MLNKISLSLFFLLCASTIFSCKESCACVQEEVPYYSLPVEIEPFFPFLGDSIVYVFVDSISKEQEIIELDATQISGELLECGIECPNTKQYECDCHIISFISPALGKNTLWITPLEEYTSINIFQGISSNVYIDYYSVEKQIGKTEVSFVENVLVSGKEYKDVLKISGKDVANIEFWFSSETGLLKIKKEGYYNYELLELKIVK